MGLAFRHDCIPDRGGGGGLRRPVFVHFAPFGLTHRRAVAQADLVLIGIDLHDLEIVFAAGREDRTVCALAALRLRWRSLSRRRSSISEMWQRPSMPSAKLDERAEGGEARNLAAHHVIDLVRREPIGPDVVELLDAQRNAAIGGVDLEHLGLDRVALLENFAGVL